MLVKIKDAEIGQRKEDAVKPLKELVEKLLYEKGIAGRLGISTEDVRNYRKYLKADKISLDLLLELALKAGCIVRVEIG